MPLSPDIIDITTLTSTRSPARAGFGIPMLVGYHTKWTERVRTYNSVQGMLSDGFTVNDALYKMADKLMSQSPSVKEFKVGRRAGASIHKWTMWVAETTEGFTYKFDVINNAGVATTVTYVNGASETTTTVGTAIRNAIGAISGITTGGTVDTVTCTVDVAGEVWDLVDKGAANQPLFKTGVIAIEQTTIDPGTGLSDDLDAILAEDSDWYAFAIDVPGDIQATLAIAWAETNRKLFGHNSGDYNVNTKWETHTSATRKRSFAIFNRKRILNYAQCAWLGKMLSYDPGKATWAFKSLSGVQPDILEGSEEDNIYLVGSRIGNWYQAMKGLPVTWEGKVFSGEYIDVVRGGDLIEARIKETWLGLLANAQKVEFTAEGLDQVQAVMNSVLEKYVTKPNAPNILASFLVTVPGIDEIEKADKENRQLKTVNIQGVLAGAVHSGKFNITLTA